MHIRHIGRQKLYGRISTEGVRPELHSLDVGSFYPHCIEQPAASGAAARIAFAMVFGEAGAAASTKRKPGRPSLPEEERRRVHLNICVTAEEKRQIEEAARIAGAFPSSWVRRLALAAVRKTRKP